MKTHLLTGIFCLFTFYTFAQLPPGAVAQYNFDNNLNDAVGNVDFGPGNNIAYFVNRFNNPTSSLFPLGERLTGYQFPNGVSDLSLSFWIRIDPSENSIQTILQVFDQNATGNGLSMTYLPSTDLMRFRFKIGGVLNEGGIALGSSFPGSWHHITFVVDRNTTSSGYTNSIYIDGVRYAALSNAISTNQNLTFLNSNQQTVISPSGPNNGGYSGGIDDLVIYERAITANEVTALQNFLPVNIADIIYVDAAATGASDGTSWTNAYTNLSDALSNSSSFDEVWVARGTYKTPTRNDTFSINFDNLEIYGGFTGNETMKSDRIKADLHTLNATIISGDIDGNDSGNIAFDNPTASDNNLRLFEINAKNPVIDGFIIEGANANATTGVNRFGGAIGLVTSVDVESISVKNCIIRNNIAALSAAGLYFASPGNVTYTIDACHFDGNLSTNGVAFYIPAANSRNIDGSITNCLFTNNISANSQSYQGIGSSSGWLRAPLNGSIINMSIVNNTFYSNREYVNAGTSAKPTLGISSTSSTSNLNVSVSNNIFYLNKSYEVSGSTTTTSVSNSIGVVFTDPFTITEVNNSIDEDLFSNITTVNNCSDVNPQLTADFKLQASSTAAIDAGDNSYIPADITTDLSGRNRIINSVVDIGAFEYEPSLSINSHTAFEVRLYPNPATNTLHIQTSIDIDTIEIYSITGSKVIVGTRSEIDISKLSSGIYIVKVTTEDNNFSISRLLKK